MTTLAIRARPDADTLLAGVAVGVLGCGSAAAAMGALGGDLPIALIGAFAGAAALMVLLVADWLSGLALVVLCLALPAPYSSDTARLAPAAIATVAAVIAWTIRRAFERHADPLGVLPRRAAWALLGAVALSAAFALSPGPAFREVINWIFLLGLLAMATAELEARPHRVVRLGLLIAGVMGVSGVFAVLQVVGVLPASFHWGARSYARATLGFGWPNELGMYMALGLPFSVFACRAARGPAGRALARVGLCASVAGLAASFSRGSWVSVMAASLVLLACGQRRFVARLWVAAIIAIIAIDAVSGGAVFARIASTEGDWVVGQRIALILSGLLMFRAHPIVGVGPGGFGANLDHFGPRIPGLWDYVGSAQNLYVHMAAETGLIGLAALLSFLGAILIVVYRAARRADPDPATASIEDHLRRTVLWSFLVACFVGFFEWPFAHGVGELIILVAAMGLALHPRTSS